MAGKTTWILVCDASRARLFRERRRDKPYELLEDFDHPDSRARVRDLMADAQGRKPDGKPGGASGHRPGAEPDTDPKEVEARRFARQLAEVLEKGLDDRAYDVVALAAPPHFLGLLRATVSERVARRLELVMGKDYTQLPEHELRERVAAERLG